MREKEKVRRNNKIQFPEIHFFISLLYFSLRDNPSFQVQNKNKNKKKEKFSTRIITRAKQNLNQEKRDSHRIKFKL